MAKGTVKKGVLAIVGLAATVAMMSVLARYLDNGFTIFQQVYLRFIVAFLLALLLFHKHLRWRVIAKLPLREWGVLAFRALTGYAIGIVLMSQAATMTTIGNVTFIAALPFIPLLGFIFLKERVTWWKLLFIVGSFFGVALLALHDFSNLLSWDVGGLIAVVATFGMALSYTARKWQKDILNNYEITLLIFMFGIGYVLLASVAVGEGVPALNLSWTLWLALVIAGAISAVKLLLANYGFQHVSAVQGGNILTLEGAWGVLFGLLFYSEIPTPHGLLGGLIIVACVIGMNFYSQHADTKIATTLDGAHTPRHAKHNPIAGLLSRITRRKRPG